MNAQLNETIRGIKPIRSPKASATLPDELPSDGICKAHNAGLFRLKYANDRPGSVYGCHFGCVLDANGNEVGRF